MPHSPSALVWKKIGNNREIILLSLLCQAFSLIKKFIYIFVRMLHQTSHQIHSSLLKRKAATLVSMLPLKQGNRNKKSPKTLMLPSGLPFPIAGLMQIPKPKKNSAILDWFSARGFPIFKGKHFNSSALLDLAVRLRTLRNFLNPVKPFPLNILHDSVVIDVVNIFSGSNLVGILWL